MDVLADVALLGEERRAVCRPTRTWIGPEARVSRTAAAAEIAPGAVGNAKKKASPCVSTSTPSWAAHAVWMTRRCSASASAYASAPSSWRSRVDPSTSVKRKVTVPEGSPGRTRGSSADHERRARRRWPSFKGLSHRVNAVWPRHGHRPPVSAWTTLAQDTAAVRAARQSECQGARVASGAWGCGDGIDDA